MPDYSTVSVTTLELSPIGFTIYHDGEAIHTEVNEVETTTEPITSEPTTEEITVETTSAKISDKTTTKELTTKETEPTTKKFKKKVVTKTTKKLKYTIKKLAKGKTYYIRIRGVNGKEVGKWSKSKKVKINAHFLTSFGLSLA